MKGYGLRLGPLGSWKSFCFAEAKRSVAEAYPRGARKFFLDFASRTALKVPQNVSIYPGIYPGIYPQNIVSGLNSFVVCKLMPEYNKMQCFAIALCFLMKVSK